MKACEFVFERPGTVQQALASKARWGGSARFLAGGQSLMPAINMRLNQPDCLIDLNGIEALRGIRLDGGHLVIGAQARHSEVAASPLVHRAAPLLAQAGKYLAHVAIRNRGTFGGSLALADPAAEWPAACLLLDAVMRVASPGGSRDVPAVRFFQGLYTTDLGEDDLLESVLIPAQHEDERSCVLESARRQGDFATAAVMVRARVQGGRLSALRMVFFAVCDTPLRDSALDQAVEAEVNRGGRAEVTGLVKAALAAHELRGDLYTAADTKRHLCGVLARRAVVQLLEP